MYGDNMMVHDSRPGSTKEQEITDAENENIETKSQSDLLEATIVSHLTDEERKRSAVYLNGDLSAPGVTKIGGRQMEINYSYFLVFIDRNPGANWMHSCRYLLINSDNMQVISIESDRPPLFGILPSSWQLVLRSPGLEDWQLIKITST